MTQGIALGNTVWGTQGIALGNTAWGVVLHSGTLNLL